MIDEALRLLGNRLPDWKMLARLLVERTLLDYFEAVEDDAMASIRRFARDGVWPEISEQERDALHFMLVDASAAVDAALAMQAKFGPFQNIESLQEEDVFVGIFEALREHVPICEMHESVTRYLEGWMQEPPTDIQPTS